MRTDKYLQDYKFIYNASVLHDEEFNNHKVDGEWAKEFANIYFALTHKEDYHPEEKKEFMDGWFDFYYHMFD